MSREYLMNLVNLAILGSQFALNNQRLVDTTQQPRPIHCD